MFWYASRNYKYEFLCSWPSPTWVRNKWPLFLFRGSLMRNKQWGASSLPPQLKARTLWAQGCLRPAEQASSPENTGEERKWGRRLVLKPFALQQFVVRSLVLGMGTISIMLQFALFNGCFRSIIIFITLWSQYFMFYKISEMLPKKQSGISWFLAVWWILDSSMKGGFDRTTEME